MLLDIGELLYSSIYWSIYCNTDHRNHRYRCRYRYRSGTTTAGRQLTTSSKYSSIDHTFSRRPFTPVQYVVSTVDNCTTYYIPTVPYGVECGPMCGPYPCGTVTSTAVRLTQNLAMSRSPLSPHCCLATYASSHSSACGCASVSSVSSVSSNPHRVERL